MTQAAQHDDKGTHMLITDKVLGHMKILDSWKQKTKMIKCISLRHRYGCEGTSTS